jgi:hemerythrin-like domain-containing protein
MDHDVLSQHHAELDRRVAALLTSADGGDCHDLAIAWDGFERELTAHFDLEERELFRRFMLEHPEEVAVLRQDHEALRRDLLALGVRADLHCLRAEAVRAFIIDLRAHATREEQSLYRWARTDVAHDAWTKIARGLREARDSVALSVRESIDHLGIRMP